MRQAAETGFFAFYFEVITFLFISLNKTRHFVRLSSQKVFMEFALNLRGCYE